MRVTALWFVSIHRSDRDEPPAPPHPGCPPSHFQALTILPAALQPTSKPSPSCPARLPVSAPNHASFRTPPPPPPGTMLSSAPRSLLRPHRARFRARPRRRSRCCWFRGPRSHLRLAPCSDSRTLVAFALPPCLIFAVPPRLRPPGRVWFAFRPAPQPRSAPRRLSPSNSELRSYLQAFPSVLADRISYRLSLRRLLVARLVPVRASVGFGVTRLVPDLARLNSGPAPLAFGVRSRVPIARPGFSSHPRTQIRPLRPSRGGTM